MDESCKKNAKTRKPSNFTLSKRDLIIIGLLSISGLAIFSEGGSIGRHYFRIGWPVLLLYIKFNSGCYNPDLNAKWIVACLFVFTLLPFMLYLVFSKQINTFKKKNGICTKIILYGLPIIAAVAAFQPEVIALLLPWFMFWTCSGYLMICSYRKSWTNTFWSIIAGILHLSYAAVFALTMITIYDKGTSIVTILSANETFPLHYQWAEQLFPMVTILLYTLPLAVIVVMLRKLNWKRKLCYLIPGILMWFYITELPCRKSKEFFKDMIPGDRCYNPYYRICYMAYYKPQDKALTKRIESRKKKTFPGKEENMWGDDGEMD
jgi:hypothetical protein